jgi:amino acid transporter
MLTSAIQWVSEFSPASCQKYLSYISGKTHISSHLRASVSREPTGWLCFTGWQAAIGAMAFLIGTVIQALIILHRPDSTYVPEPWHGTLLVIALIISCFVFNTLLAKQLPTVEGLVFIIHVCGLFALAIPLWALSPRKPAHQVFTEFSNGGGWPSMGVAFMVGWLPISASLGGIDCVVHMGTCPHLALYFTRRTDSD